VSTGRRGSIRGLGQPKKQECLIRNMEQSVLIKTEGDFEVFFFHETLGLLADIMNSDLYNVIGEPPNQNILFHTDKSFDLFLILLVELFSEGKRSVTIQGQIGDISLFSAIRWFCDKYPSKSHSAGLVSSYAVLKSWLDAKPVVTFEYKDWCDIKIRLGRTDLIYFGANMTKHHIFRLRHLFNT